MNVTEKSFNQLAIMRKRVQLNRRIKDCDKLFFQEDFWHDVHEHQVSKDEHGHEQRLLISQTLRQRGSYSQLSTKQFQWLIEACQFFLRNIFVSEAIDDHNRRTPLERLLIFNQEWKTVNWIITVKVASIFQDRLFNQIEQYIDDERFKIFLYQVLLRMQQKDSARYQALARDVYLTLHILDVLERQNKLNKLKIFIDQNKLYLGLTSTKKQTIATLKTLNLMIDAENECYFTHFSRPLQLQGYSIKRDWKLKRICIEVPQQMLIKLSHLFQYGDFHNQIAKARGALIHQSIRQIASTYQQELDQIAHYYFYADNYQKLGKLFYFAHLSLLKTIACKFGCTIGQARKKLKNHQIDSFKLPKKEILQSKSLKQSQLASRIL